MTSYELNPEEAQLIDALRSGTPDEQGRMFSRACNGAWEKRDPMPPVEPVQAPAPPKWAVPPKHATWREWTAEDFESARVQSSMIENAAEQFARFLVGWMALQGMITAEQARDVDQALFLTLREGLDAASQGYVAHGYKSLQQLCEFAEVGQREFRLKQYDEEHQS